MRFYLEEFLDHLGQPNLKMNKWKTKHFYHLYDYLLQRPNEMTKKPLSRSSANKYMTLLKVVFHRAISTETINHDPCKGFKMKRKQSKKVSLTQDEIQKIENHNLGDNKSLDRVRWLFLFSIYTGLRFSDATALKRDQIIKQQDGTYIISLEQKKTGEPLFRPMLKKAVEIYEMLREKYSDQEHVLPRISNQKVNAYLKVIAELCNIKKHLTHHVARHTFATTVLLENGVDIKTASFFMGHKSLKTTEVYARITDKRAREVADRLNDSL